MKKISKQKTFTEALDNLLSIKLIKRENTENSVRYILYNAESFTDKNSQNYEFLEDIILKEIKKFFVKMNFISTGLEKNILRSKEKIPQFGHIPWSMIAPCYLSPLRTSQREHGWLVCEIFIHKKLNKDNTLPLVRKYKTIVSQKNKQGVQKILPIIIFRNMQRDILMNLRHLGFVTISLASFQLSSLLSGLNKLLHLAFLKKKNNFDMADLKNLVKDLLDNIVSKESRIGNLQGYIFEVLVFFLYMKLNINNTIPVKHNKILKWRDESSYTHQAEIDIYVETNTSITLIECKSWKTYSDEKVKKWVDNKMCKFLNWSKKPEITKKVEVICILANAKAESLQKYNSKFQKEYPLLKFENIDSVINLSNVFPKKELRNNFKYFRQAIFLNGPRGDKKRAL